MAEHSTVNNNELLPIPYANRSAGKFSYFCMWIGIAVIIATFSLGGDGVSNIKLGWVALACLLANILCGFIMTLTGDVGVEHGITFPIFLRAPFGRIGSSIPLICRSILGCIWFGIQSYYGATAMTYIIAYFTGFDNWFIIYLLFVFAQTFNVAMGFRAIEKFSNFAAPCIVAIALWMMYALFGQAEAAGIDVWNSVVVPGGGVTTTATLSIHVFVLVFFTNLSYWSTTSADSQTLARNTKAPKNERNWFKRNTVSLIGHCIALPITETFCVVIGGISMLVAGNWNPVEVLQKTASGVALLILLLVIVLAQWSTNAAANMMLPAVTLYNIFPKFLSYKKAVWLCGIIAAISFPWEIMAKIGGFLNVMSSIYAPIAGICVVDYYFIRKRRLNVPELYDDKGQYFYGNGWNIPGMISLILGCASTFALPNYAYGVGFVVGGIVYYALSRNWFMKYPQPEITGKDMDYLGISVGREWKVEL